jgi:hypothetical protein
MTKLVIAGSPQPRDPIQGLPDPKPRLEVHDFVKNEKYFSLYIQALRKFLVPI